LSDEEIGGEYERNTGHVIVRRLRGIDPARSPGVLVRNHGPFAWGETPSKAVQNAVLLEEIAAIAYQTVVLNATARPIPAALHDRHFLRKHGPGATYGQR
jgi:L-ribulose-5-phosphate 4-epimerase